MLGPWAEKPQRARLSILNKKKVRYQKERKKRTINGLSTSNLLRGHLTSFYNMPIIEEWLPKGDGYQWEGTLWGDEKF